MLEILLETARLFGLISISVFLLWSAIRGRLPEGVGWRLLAGGFFLVAVGLALEHGAVASGRGIFIFGLGVIAIALKKLVPLIEPNRHRQSVRRGGAWFQSAFEHTGLGTTILDQSGRIIRVNPVLRALTGYTEDDLTGRAVQDLLHPDEPGDLLDPGDVPRAGDGWHKEVVRRFVHKNGDTRWFRAHVSVLTDATETETGTGSVFIVHVLDVTQQREAMDTLSQVNAEIELINEITDIAIFFARGKTVVRANQAYWDLIGGAAGGVSAVTPDRGDIEDYKRLGYPTRDSYESLIRAAIPILASGGIYSAQQTMRRGNGSLFQSRIAGKSLDQGDPSVNSVWLIEDISARKTAEDERDLLSHTFEGIIETIPTVFGRIDEDGVVTESRGNGLSRLGLKDGQLVGSHILERFPQIEHEFTRALAGESVTFESRGTANGKPWWLINYLAPDAVTSRGMMTFSLDVTDLKSVENALAESEKRFRMLSRVSPVGVYFADASGAFVYVNDKWVEIVGLDIAEVQDGGWLTAVDPEDRERVSREWERAVGYVQPYEAEIHIVPAGGEDKWVIIQATPLFGEHDEPQGFVGTITDITERKETEQKIYRQAKYDSLTGLPNRSLFRERLSHELVRVGRSGKPLGVMFIDLDRFKWVNDTLGHGAGDELLKEVARRLTGTFRQTDTVARLGGDEFTVLLPEIRRDGDAEIAASKVLSALAEPFNIDGRELFVSGSIGITIAPTDGADMGTLMRNADNAMYRAKEAGRNGFAFFEPDMDAKVRERLELENDLRRSIERNELELRYQPIVEFRTGRTLGVEALARWRHPEYGYIPPDRFIPIAEESSLIADIGDWVLRTACRQAREWYDAGISGAHMSVNLSSRQFNYRDCEDMVRDALEASDLPPSLLTLEITENTLFGEKPELIHNLNNLRSLGVNVSLDDFGTGYSSLSYLKRFPFDTLKIDRSFVSDLSNDPGDAALCQAIISMAHNLGIQVVAEGVETPEQFNFLHDIGCDYAQGFFLSMPIRADEYTELARGDRNIVVDRMEKSDAPGTVAAE